jgi:hypothetical protein
MSGANWIPAFAGMTKRQIDRSNPSFPRRRESSKHNVFRAPVTEGATDRNLESNNIRWYANSGTYQFTKHYAGYASLVSAMQSH